MNDTHTCSYHCQRPECVLAQRDELREALEVARNGLAWYQDYCPEMDDEEDRAAMAQIDAALEHTTPGCTLTQRDELCAEVDRLVGLLQEIGDIAHEHSTGPAVPDAYWEIRAMAYAGTEL